MWIVEKLGDLCNIRVISEDLEEEITEVQFMDLRQKNFKSNVLYFSNNAQSSAELPPQCIIAEPDISVSPASLAANLAVVSDNDFGYAFNTAFQIVIDSHKDNYYESMMSTLDRCRDVDTLIDIASQTFGASLVFIDRDFRILSYSTQIPVTDKLWMHNIEQGYCDYEFITAVRSLKSVQMSDSSMMPIEVSCTSSPFKKFACRVYCRDIWIGFLIVIENFDSYRSEHAEMLRILSGVVGYAVMQYAPNYLYMTGDYHRFLYNLLIGADISALPEAYRNLTFPSEIQLLYCRATDDESLFPQERELSESLTSVVPGCHVIGRRHSAVIIGSHDMLQKIGMMLKVFPARCGVKIGVSLPFSDISELRSHHQDANDAFEVGSQYDPDLSIYTFEDYGMYVMLSKIASTEDLSRYLHPAIPKLAEYDAANAANLEATLHAYLKNSCNTTDTANALFLHRNSVIYRLHRIEELCDIDLDDTDTRFRLRLSFAISNVISRKRKWPAGKSE